LKQQDGKKDTTNCKRFLGFHTSCSFIEPCWRFGHFGGCSVALLLPPPPMGILA
jgi:hypothetical protein